MVIASAACSHVSSCSQSFPYRTNEASLGVSGYECVGFGTSLLIINMGFQIPVYPCANKIMHPILIRGLLYTSRILVKFTLEPYTPSRSNLCMCQPFLLRLTSSAERVATCHLKTARLADIPPTPKSPLTKTMTITQPKTGILKREMFKRCKIRQDCYSWVCAFTKTLY